MEEFAYHTSSKYLFSLQTLSLILFSSSSIHGFFYFVEGTVIYILCLKSKST